MDEGWYVTFKIFFNEFYNFYTYFLLKKCNDSVKKEKISSWPPTGRLIVRSLITLVLVNGTKINTSF